MKYLKGTIKCPGCGLSTTITFKAPHVVQPTVVRPKCSGCESELMCKFGIRKGQKVNTELEYRVTVTKPSAALLEMLKEEALLRAQSEASQDQAGEVGEPQPERTDAVEEQPVGQADDRAALATGT